MDKYSHNIITLVASPLITQNNFISTYLSQIYSKIIFVGPHKITDTKPYFRDHE